MKIEMIPCSELDYKQHRLILQLTNDGLTYRILAAAKQLSMLGIVTITSECDYGREVIHGWYGEDRVVHLVACTIYRATVRHEFVQQYYLLNKGRTARLEDLIMHIHINRNFGDSAINTLSDCQYSGLKTADATQEFSVLGTLNNAIVSTAQINSDWMEPLGYMVDMVRSNGINHFHSFTTLCRDQNIDLREGDIPLDELLAVPNVEVVELMDSEDAINTVGTALGTWQFYQDEKLFKANAEILNVYINSKLMSL